MSTELAGLDTTTVTGAVASLLDGYVRALPDHLAADSDGSADVDGSDTTGGSDGSRVVRSWTLTGGSAAARWRVATEVRRVLVDDAEEVDDGESYALLQGVAETLRAAGFEVDEVREGWRTIAVDVVGPVPDAPVEAATPDKAQKAPKAKKVKPPKPAKAPKMKKSGGTKTATDTAPTDAAPTDTVEAVGAVGADAGTEVRSEGSDVDAPAASASARPPADGPAPKKPRGGLLRRWTAGSSPAPADAPAADAVAADAPAAVGPAADAPAADLTATDLAAADKAPEAGGGSDVESAALDQPAVEQAAAEEAGKELESAAA